MIHFNLFFRCSATNENFKASKQIQHSLEAINSITVNRAELLPALQSDQLFVANGSSLVLHCAPTTTATDEGNAIRWSFRKRSDLNAPSIEVKPTNRNELLISNVSVEQHDGFYTCSFGDDYHQVCKCINIYLFNSVHFHKLC